MVAKRAADVKRKREAEIDTPKASSRPSKKPTTVEFKTAQNGSTKGQKKHAKSHVKSTSSTIVQDDSGALNVQIVTGSYERVLHGFSANIPRHLLRQQSKSSEEESTEKETPNGSSDPSISFSDTFLFAAHTSAIRCLALSPAAEANKRLLATGSADERINLYSISTLPPNQPNKNIKPDLPTLSNIPVSENSRNRSLGSLVHHDRAITALQFATKSKLFSGAEDSTIAISRTRDWTVLSSIKAPIPKPVGRPSGDTAAPGEVPAGINDFAIHPSQKLMLSVGRGERCMRLWNLMTGKKAGVLNFDRDLLIQVGETKHSSGEARHVLWNNEGEAFVVGFERGAAVFGIDSKPVGVLRPTPTTKFHTMKFLPGAEGVLAAATEDGRILFFATKAPSNDEESDVKNLPVYPCVGQLGGRDAGFPGRIKDFEVLPLPTSGEEEGNATLLVTTVSSDGAVRLWTMKDLTVSADSEETTQDVGTLLGTHETGNRITCMGAFLMGGDASSGDVDSAAEDEASVDEDSS